uniref:Putative DegT/DnrJ/EryC1/StrS aminotransferase family protein n=1 Tax=viral metagenome TaxID=1070528 RepID=A0A6M3KTU9_9ZZZZ
MYERNDVIRQFEKTIAKYAGAKYGVAVESCSSALFLSCLYCKVKEVTIPKKTYFSVPCGIIHAGGKVKFEDLEWSGAYQLKPYPIWDSAVRFKKDMYVPGTYYCLSFQTSKHLPIGRGGMILTDDDKSVEWFQRMRFDGRTEIPKEQDTVKLIGFNLYMTSEQAARGLELFYWRAFNKDLQDIKQPYMDLSTVEAYA